MVDSPIGLFRHRSRVYFATGTSGCVRPRERRRRFEDRRGRVEVRPGHGALRRFEVDPAAGERCPLEARVVAPEVAGGLSADILDPFPDLQLTAADLQRARDEEGPRIVRTWAST